MVQPDAWLPGHRGMYNGSSRSSFLGNGGDYQKLLNLVQWSAELCINFVT